MMENQIENKIENKIEKQSDGVAVNKRDGSLDVMKGLAMVFVVLGHVLHKYFPADYVNNFLFKIGTSFHMPLLLFVSGYLMGRKKVESFTNNYFFTRSIRLLCPWIIWTVVVAVIQRDNYFEILLLNPFFWFLPCLWMFNFIYFVSVKFKNTLLAILTEFAVLFVLFVVTRKYASAFFINIFKYCPFYFSALFLNRYKEKISSGFLQKVMICGTVLYPFSFFLYSLGNEGQFILNIMQKIGVDSRLFSVVLKTFVSVYNIYVVGFLGICFFWFVCKKTYFLVNDNYGKSLFIQKYLCYVGIYSLPVYILHIFFLKPGVIYPALSFLCGVTIPVVVGMIVKKIKFLGQVLFGL